MQVRHADLLRIEKVVWSEQIVCLLEPIGVIPMMQRPEGVHPPDLSSQTSMQASVLDHGPLWYTNMWPSIWL